jgi:hypothetical protein
MKKIHLILPSLSLCLFFNAAYAGTVGAPNHTAEAYASLLYLQPNADNLRYAVFVSGNQPYHQSWYNQTINPAYSPNFDIGFNYSAEDTGYNSALSWLHLDTSDSASKQANESIQNATVEFVGPSYDVGPLVFGIKHAESTVKFAFDSILINAGRSIQPLPHLRINVFGGLDLLRIKQTITTVFGDYQGAEPTAYSYGLPADPAFSFQTQNVSTYLGIGPDLGLDARYQRDNGLGVAGSFLGTVTVGSVSSKDSFKSTSTRLNLLGVNPSQQFLTTPNATQVVPGVDGRLSVFYDYQGPKVSKLTLDGYSCEREHRFLSIVNT